MSRKERPYSPYMLMIAEHESGMILAAGLRLLRVRFIHRLHRFRR